MFPVRKDFERCMKVSTGDGTSAHSSRSQPQKRRNGCSPSTSGVKKKQISPPEYTEKKDRRKASRQKSFFNLLSSWEKEGTF